MIILEEGITNILICLKVKLPDLKYLHHTIISKQTQIKINGMGQCLLLDMFRCYSVVESVM